jgi:hypothetical protein
VAQFAVQRLLGELAVLAGAQDAECNFSWFFTAHDL